MIGTLKRYIKTHVLPTQVKESGVVEAYDLWAENYDAQPGNLMLDLDETLFATLLANVPVKGRRVADIGCGTGRHWAKIFEKRPADLTGFDVSQGMLNKLVEKFPSANTRQITDDRFLDVPGQIFDVVLSTLTVAHIENIEKALEGWCRMLKYNADMIVTDFHPDALAFGGKRTFKHQNKQVAVQNFVHPTALIRKILLSHGFKVVTELEKKVDGSVKHYYTAQHAGHVYEKFEGLPIIYGIHFKRG